MLEFIMKQNCQMTSLAKTSSEKQVSILDFTWFQSNTFPPL